MKLPSLLPLLCLSLNQVIFVAGLVTLETIRDLTKLTDELRERILETGPASRVERDPMVEVLGGQRVLGGGDEDGDDIEDVRGFLIFPSFLLSFSCNSILFCLPFLRLIRK